MASTHELRPFWAKWYSMTMTIQQLHKKSLSYIKSLGINKTAVRVGLEAILGGLAICLGTIASRYCPYPILSPLLFALGIFAVMAFDLKLITRHVPTSPKLRFFETVAVLAINLLVAELAGVFSPYTVSPPEHLFALSIAGGVVIGLVSLNNLYKSPYQLALATMLMYMFVMCGLPHCVVYAFYNVDFPTLLIVIAGNLLGGLVLRFSFEVLDKLRKK